MLLNPEVNLLKKCQRYVRILWSYMMKWFLANLQLPQFAGYHVIPCWSIFHILTIELDEILNFQRRYRKVTTVALWQHTDWVAGTTNDNIGIVRDYIAARLYSFTWLGTLFANLSTDLGVACLVPVHLMCVKMLCIAQANGTFIPDLCPPWCLIFLKWKTYRTSKWRCWQCHEFFIVKQVWFLAI